MIEIKKELEELRKKVPPDLLVSIIRSLYFQTAWELPKELVESGIDADLVWNLQLKRMVGSPIACGGFLPK